MLGMLAPLLSLLGLETTELTDRLKRQAILWGAVAFLGIVGICFLLVAINAGLTYAVGPVIAPLIIAVAAVVIAVAIVLVTHILDGADARRALERKRSAERTAMMTTAAITALPLILKSPLLRDIGIPAGAALASALMLRRSGGSTRTDPGSRR
ncbi:MAG TPA: hypothetical protein VHZ56_12785 [Devosia sp.]|nr:hypothetical protein [Devosia sp.]